MKIRFFILFVLSFFLTSCSFAVDVAREIHDSDKMAHNYIFGVSIAVNEYIEKVVQALDTNDRELLVSLFPEHARSKIDNFDEKINNVFYGYNDDMYTGKIIRYKLNWNNNYEESANRGKFQTRVYSSSSIEFADEEGKYNRTIHIYMEIRTRDDFIDNNVGISEFAIYDSDLSYLGGRMDLERDGYDIYAFGYKVKGERFGDKVK